MADRYRIERELGRGGMATVYLAQDLRHERPVALKVLHPELAATLGPERFLREIKVAARLQHPHILTVLDSGEAGGLLWYTMPYVEGESLRDRLEREQQLPVGDAVRITTEAASALDYAHRHGVVHRDIKPENLLLSDGQALVADFGVALAVESAGGERLTETGLSLGTPSYMSPEQASGSSKLDGKSDQYSLACVVYEMLAGEPPFTGPTPQAVIARRFMETPRPLTATRDQLPPAIDSAVAKALARVPADRFATVGEFAAALQATELPRRHIRGKWLTRQRALWGGGLALAGLVIASVAHMSLRPRVISAEGTLLASGALRERERLLLADFGTRQVDSALGGVLTEAIRIDLAQSPAITLVPMVQVAEALGRMRKPASARLDPALARELAVREGITAVVTGEVARAGPQYVLSAQLISASNGEMLAAHRETAADSTELIAAVDRLSGRLRARIGESLKSIRREPPLEQVSTASLPALRLYSAAVRSGDYQGNLENAIALLEDAITIDSGFGMAYRLIGVYAGNLNRLDRALQGYSAAIERGNRLTERERNIALGDYYSLVNQPRRAIAAFQAVLENHPRDREALNNLAVLFIKLHQRPEAEPLLQRVLTIDSLSWVFHWNLFIVQMELKKWSEAETSYEQAIRQLPDVPQVWLLGLPLAEQRGDYATAEARALTFKKRFGTEPYWRATANRELANFAVVRGRLRDAERYLREGMAARSEASAPGDYLADAIALASVLAAVAGEPARGVREVERALARYPLDSLGPLDRPYLGLASFYALIGRPDQGRRLVVRYEQTVDPRYRSRAKADVDLTQGRIALAERRWSDAIAKFQEAAREGTPAAFAMPELGHAYDFAGMTDSAIVLYERYVATPDVMRSGTDAIEYAGVHRRLGELYERHGERGKARASYVRFIELWKDCDPELRPKVIEAKQRLAVLSGEPST